MAPFCLMSAGVSLLAKSFGLFSSVSSLARCTSAVPAIKSLSTTSGGPPKRPLNGYLRFLVEQRPRVQIHYPGIKLLDVTKKLAQQWRTLSPEQKRPFNEAAVVAREKFKMDLQRYQAQLSPAQSAIQAEEKSERLAKRKTMRKKRELTRLGKPKRTRSAMNIYMSEHYEEARGHNNMMKLKSMTENWMRLSDYQKKVYIQLSEDDKVRYKNEMKVWEEHMMEIGREDLVRKTELPRKKKPVVKKKAVVRKKSTGTMLKPKAKTALKASSAGGKSSAAKTTTGTTKRG